MIIVVCIVSQYLLLHECIHDLSGHLAFPVLLDQHLPRTVYYEQIREHLSCADEVYVREEGRNTFAKGRWSGPDLQRPDVSRVRAEGT